MILPLVVHRVRTDDGTLRNLTDWCEWLRDGGYQFFSLHQLLPDAFTDEWPEHARDVILTFDDLPQYHVHATELMLDLGVDFTSYVFTGRYRGEAADFKAMKDMVECGWQIGAHGHDHLNPLTAKPEELAAEVYTSQKHLTEALGAPPLDYAIPFGRMSEVVKVSCKAMGFRSVRTTDQGLIGPRTDPFWLPSRSCDPRWPLEEFKKVVREVEKQGECVGGRCVPSP